MNTTTQQQKILYGILALVVAVLVVLIGWFVYLLAKPTDTTTSNNENENIAAVNMVNNTNKTTTTNNANVANTNSAATNTNSNTNTTVNNSNASVSNTNEGLVEPDVNSNINSTSNANNNSNTNTAEGKKTVTLYFPKTGAACGEVTAVQRDITPDETDPYGQIILEDMRGPNEEEVGYTDGIPSTIRLKEVKYTSAGSIITVNEAYNDLSDCEKKTVDAQFIKTANTMFDASPDGPGEVVVGETTTETDTNTNQ